MNCADYSRDLGRTSTRDTRLHAQLNEHSLRRNESSRFGDMVFQTAEKHIALWLGVALCTSTRSQTRTFAVPVNLKFSFV